MLFLYFNTLKSRFLYYIMLYYLWFEIVFINMNIGD